MDRVVRAFRIALYLAGATVAFQVSVAPIGALQDSEINLDRIDALATGEADAGLLSRVLLVACGDRIILHRADGFASWELRVAVTTATRFGIASVSKVMTEILVDMLAAEGRLDLDAAVSP